MKLIFLDIDGVLNSFKFLKKQEDKNIPLSKNEVINLINSIDPLSVQLINELVVQTGAQVVVTSTWRIFMTTEEINQSLKACGADFEVMDCTPHLSTLRGLEIQSFIDSLDEKPTHLVIIDDDSDMEHLLPFLVKTSMSTGITMEDVEKCKGFLLP